MAYKPEEIDIREDRELLARELGYAFERSIAASVDRRAMVDTWRRTYKNVVPAPIEPWRSNLSFPLTQYMIDASAIKLSNAALGSEPMFEVSALEPEYINNEQDVENYLQLWLDKICAKTKNGQAIKQALIAGECWLKPGIIHTGKPDIKELQSITLTQLPVKPTTDYIIFEDMMVLPFDAPTFKQARGAFARKWLRWNDIVTAEKSNAFQSDAVEQLKTQWQTTNPTTQAQEIAGYTTEVPREIWDTKFECWEGIYRWVKPGDDLEKEWLISYYLPTNGVSSSNNGVVLKAVEYTQLFGNLWFFVPIVCDPEPNSMHGNSMIAKLQPMQQWMNATFNQSADAITISIHPPIAMGPSTTGKNLRWAPQERWPVSPQDVQMMQGNNAAFAGISVSMGMMEMVRTFAERVSGNSDPSIGRETAQRKTAYEIGAVLQSGDQVQEYIVSTLQIGTDEGCGFKGYAELLFEIIKRFLPKIPLKYRSRKTGTKDPWSTIDPAILEGNYEFTPTGHSATSNPDVKFKKASAIMQNMQQNPFSQISPLDTPEDVLDKVQRMYKAESSFVQAIGFEHPEVYIGGQPENVEQAMAIAMVLNPQAAIAVMQRAEKDAQGGGGIPLEQGMVSPETQAGAVPVGTGGMEQTPFRGGQLPGSAGQGGVEKS